MYSRSYYPDQQERITPPQNYDGTAFLDQPADTEVREETIETSAPIVESTAKTEESIMTGLGKIPFLSGIFGKGGIFGETSLSFPKIGTEEILILATAAFLFFSKSGDKESAIILLLLLLIN